MVTGGKVLGIPEQLLWKSGKCRWKMGQGMEGALQRQPNCHWNPRVFREASGSAILLHSPSLNYPWPAITTHLSSFSFSISEFYPLSPFSNEIKCNILMTCHIKSHYYPTENPCSCFLNWKCQWTDLDLLTTDLSAASTGSTLPKIQVLSQLPFTGSVSFSLKQACQMWHPYQTVWLTTILSAEHSKLTQLALQSAAWVITHMWKELCGPHSSYRASTNVGVWLAGSSGL